MVATSVQCIKMVGPDALAVCGAHRGLPVRFLLLR